MNISGFYSIHLNIFYGNFIYAIYKNTKYGRKTMRGEIKISYLNTVMSV